MCCNAFVLEAETPGAESSDYSVYIPDGIEIISLCANSNELGALDRQGKVYIWFVGSNVSMYVPDDLPPIKQFDMGDEHYVALDYEGRVHWWGSPTYGQCDFPEDLPPIEAIAADGYKTVLLTRDGKVLSFGSINFGAQEYVPDLPKIAQISCSAFVTAAVAEDGAVYAWEDVKIHAPAAKGKLAIAAAFDVLVIDFDGVLRGNALRKRQRDLSNDWLFKEASVRDDVIRIAAGGEECVATIDKNGGIDVWGFHKEATDGVIFVPEGLPPIVDAAMYPEGIICLGADGNLYHWGSRRERVRVPDFAVDQEQPVVKVDTLQIPDVCWNTPAYAREAIRGLPIKIVEIRELWAPNVTPGMIVGQWPLPGAVELPADNKAIGLCIYISSDRR